MMPEGRRGRLSRRIPNETGLRARTCRATRRDGRVRSACLIAARGPSNIQSLPAGAGSQHPRVTGCRVERSSTLDRDTEGLGGRILRGLGSDPAPRESEDRGSVAIEHGRKPPGVRR